MMLLSIWTKMSMFCRLAEIKFIRSHNLAGQISQAIPYIQSFTEYRRIWILQL